MILVEKNAGYSFRPHLRGGEVKAQRAPPKAIQIVWYVPCASNQPPAILPRPPPQKSPGPISPEGSPREPAVTSRAIVASVDFCPSPVSVPSLSCGPAAVTRLSTLEVPQSQHSRPSIAATTCGGRVVLSLIPASDNPSAARRATTAGIGSATSTR